MASNINNHINSAQAGIDLDSSINQIPKGKLSFALNANIENFDSNSTSYQNEQGNVLCLEYPEGLSYHGGRYIQEINKHIIFLVGDNGESEIGYMENNDCIYHTIVNSTCLNFNKKYPILKVVHKITNCSVEIYWTDGYNQRRFLDINNVPYKKREGSDDCDPEYTDELDCNQLNVQPNFNIPLLTVQDVVSGGNLTAGTVQFAVQYSNVSGDAYTSYYSITNPVPIANPAITTPDFNYPVGKSVVLNIRNIDNTGYFEYFNIAVIKTVNNITSAELIGTYNIEGTEKTIIYNGQNQTQIQLSINDIFEKFPYYEIAQDVTTVQDIIIWDQLTSIDRINYQHIANKIKLLWESYRIPSDENYADELNAANLRGYLRDEVYSLGIVFLLTNGKETDQFHIPGRVIGQQDSLPNIPETDPDYVTNDESASPYWKQYNTASVTGTDPNYSSESAYKGPYQYGEFAYWESSETYPCNEELWGDLAGLPIRHFKMPDVKICPIFENPTIETDSDGKYTNLQMQNNAIYALGIKIDPVQIKYLIQNSNLSQEQKDQIAGFKIVRGNRDVNKSIIAKGILRNVGKYTRESTDYYFPNYPYNDLREDPFLLKENNAYNAECRTYEIVTTNAGSYTYLSCFDGQEDTEEYQAGETIVVCALTKPTFSPTDSATLTVLAPYETYSLYVKRKVNLNSSFVHFQYIDYITDETKDIFVNESDTKYVNVKVGFSPVVVYNPDNNKVVISKVDSFTVNVDCYPDRLSAFDTDDTKYRHVFNSPETSFGQPFLPDTVKLESVFFGAGKAHFTEVKKNALYRLLSKEAQEDALDSSAEVADITGDLNVSALFAAYDSYLQIYLNGITRRNYGWSYNSILNYNYYADIDNNLGIKQRKIDHTQYLYPGVQSVNEQININNYQRETSVYLKTKEETSPFPFPSDTNSLLDGFGDSLIEDRSRFIASQINCGEPEEQFDISSVAYYASLKNIIPNQWGQINSFEMVDTGYQVLFSDSNYITQTSIFGGDTFICKFSFKTKVPFFIDNRVGSPDDSDIYYDEIGNIAYPEYWHSARSVLFDYVNVDKGLNLKNIISTKAHNFDCPNNQLPEPTEEAPNPNRTFYDGKMYMFAYGIPTFYCETSVNVDLRQAFNNKEGDFYPHVGTGIPDDWLQESFVPIVQDNTYHYNVTYSKQNKENFFTSLPDNWQEELCFTNFPFRAIYSDPQQSYSDNRINSWLLYRANSYFDFPQNYGDLISLDGIQNKAVLARFENKGLLYNTLLTIDTSNPQAAYLGNDSLFRSSPPVDFAETDLGYMGSQNKFLLKIPQGQISIDAKRGQVFLISGTQLKDISSLGSGLNHFFKDHLPFEILNYFPEINIDNHFHSVGIHGVYDSRYNRVIITKLDYIPKLNDIKYDSVTDEFYIENELNFKQIVELQDSDYFCNKSWTVSYNLNTQSWISFHSYLPNFYIGDNNFFYSGLNIGCDIDLIAAEIVAPTTTTTTTSVPFDCELEAEFQILDCELSGNAQLLTECDVEGEAYFQFDITTTTTTTSTSSSTTTTTTTIEPTTTTTTTTLP